MATPFLEDRFAITDLMIRYTCALDAGAIETVVACFTNDCVLDPVVGRLYRGKEEVRAYARRIADYRRDHGGQFRHVISNFAIDVQGDVGRVTCYLLDFLTLDGHTELLSPGTYDCGVRRIGGTCLLHTRTVHLDTPFSGDRWQKPDQPPRRGD